MSKENGGPAFPWCGDLNDCPTINLGMTLRDYFAAKAMQGMLSVERVLEAFEDGKSTTEDMAANAYLAADAMLEARK